MTSDISLVARREITEKLRNRGFLLFTLLLVVILPGGVAASSFLSHSDSREYSLAVASPDAMRLASAAKERAASLDMKVSIDRVRGRDAAEHAVTEGDADAALAGGGRVLTASDPARGLTSLLQSAARHQHAAEALRAAGVSDDQVATALAPAPLTFTDLGGARNQNDGVKETMVVMIGAVLLFMALYLYGYWIAAGVVEEKSSRVIEVVLAAVRPGRLLTGKVLGIGVLALAQLALSVALALGVARVVGVPLPDVALGAVGSVLLWFVLGFAFYSCIFAVAGALVSKQEDLQYTQMPPMVFILVGYFVAIQYQVGGVGASVAHVLAYVPPLSPLLMPVLTASGEMALWEVPLVAVITGAATVGLVRVAARLYTGSVLRFGGRVSLVEAWK